jgi:FHA domain
MAPAELTVHAPGQRPRSYPLQVGDECVVGRAPLAEEAGIVVDAERVSRRHVELVVTRNAVVVRDLESTYGTYRRGTRVASVRIADRQETLAIGAAELVIVPPARDHQTMRDRRRLVTTEAQRRTLAILCRDHVVRPSGRGAWILGDEEISAILGGTPNAGTISKQIADIARLLDLEHPPKSIREALVDWAIATGEIDAADIAMVEDELVRRTGMGYDDRIRSFERSVRLRRNVERTA